MSAGKYNIEIEKKATFSKILTLYSTYLGVDNVGNVPLDLTGATVAAAIKRNVNDTAVVINFTAAVLDEALGKITFSLTAAQTAALAITTGIWDLRVTFPSGHVRRVIEGTVFVSKGVA